MMATGLVELTAAVEYATARELCYAVKAQNPNAFVEMAEQLAAVLSGESLTLIPVPNSSGRAEYTLAIAELLAANSGITVVDALAAEPRPLSWYETKKTTTGGPRPQFHQISAIPVEAVLFDTVVGTGATIRAAAQASGVNRALAYAVDLSTLAGTGWAYSVSRS